MSTENTTSNFLAGSPEKMLADAVPLMLLILPWNVLSPTASSRMLTSWPSLQIGAIQLADLRDNFQFGKIEHVGHRHTGLHLIAFANVGHLHAGEEACPAGSGEWPPGRSSATATSPARGAAAREPSPCCALLRFSLSTAISACACSCRDLMSLSSCFSRRLRFFEVQIVLSLIDLRKQFVALHFQFGAAHRVPRSQQFDLVLVVADGQVGLRLLDLLVDLIQFELLLFEARLHFGIVELDDQVLLFRERAQRGQSASPAPCRTGSAQSA